MSSILYETPVGAIDGVNAVYTVSNAPSFIQMNGAVQTQGIDYQVSGLTITFTYPPVLDLLNPTILRSFYFYQTPTSSPSSSGSSATSLSVARLKSDIARMLRGTSLREVRDFYGTAAAASNRMLARIDTEETRRTLTMATPFYDNVQDYALPADYKRMIDIRPQVNRTTVPGRSHFEQTATRQFNERLNPNSFSIRWNNMVKSIRAQQLPGNTVIMMDAFDGPTSNGSWTAEGDASGLYTEILNFVEGNGSLGFNLSGSTGAADIVNTTAAVTDLSNLRYSDSSVYAIYLPLGYSSRFTGLSLRRGSSAGNYKEASVISKIDGTGFTDGWNLVKFDWNTANAVGTPDDTKNTYRRLGFAYSAGSSIPGVLVDNWTDSIGNLYEIEYYSNFLFRTSAGVWIDVPTLDTDLLNVSLSSYEILKTEMMIDITKYIRIGAVQEQELTDWRLMLNGQPQSRYVKDPPYHGLYNDYLKMFPSSAITTVTRTYDFDV